MSPGIGLRSHHSRCFRAVAPGISRSLLVLELRRINRGNLYTADRSPGLPPPATFGGNGVAVVPEFSITVRNLPDLPSWCCTASWMLHQLTASPNRS